MSHPYPTSELTPIRPASPLAARPYLQTPQELTSVRAHSDSTILRGEPSVCTPKTGITTHIIIRTSSLLLLSSSPPSLFSSSSTPSLPLPPTTRLSMFTLSEESQLPDLLESNHHWAKQTRKHHPDLFPTNAKGQQPHTLFITCSDSRVSERCLGVLPGEVFTWRNVANICRPDDPSLLATLEFAVNCLRVNKIVVCGHTDCGGCATVVGGKLSELRANGCLQLAQHFQVLEETRLCYEEELAATPDPVRLLAIRHAERQFVHLKSNPTVKNALRRGDLQVHAVLYSVDNGLLEKLESTE